MTHAHGVLYAKVKKMVVITTDVWYADKAFGDNNEYWDWFENNRECAIEFITRHLCLIANQPLKDWIVKGKPARVVTTIDFEHAADGDPGSTLTWRLECIQ